MSKQLHKYVSFERIIHINCEKKYFEIYRGAAGQS